MILDREDLVTNQVRKFANWAYMNGIDFNVLKGKTFVETTLDKYYYDMALKYAIKEVEDKFSCKLTVSKENETDLDRIARLLRMDRNQISRAKGNDVDIFIRSDGSVDSFLIDGR